MVCVLIALLTLICGLILPSEGLIRIAKRPDHRLYTAEYTSCMQDSLVTFDRFDVSYYSRNLSIVLNIEGYSNIDANVTFEITVDAYGSQRARFTFDPCDMNLGNICPLTKNSRIGAHGVLPVSLQDVKMVPNLAWTIPDFEGFINFRMYRSEDLENSSINKANPLSCAMASLNNGHTFQNRVILALSIVSFFLAIAGFLGFYLIGMEHSIYMLRPVITNSMPSIQYITDLLQCIVLTAAVGVKQPKVLVSWASNFAWIIGLIPNGQLDNSIDSLRKHSGGKLNSHQDGIHCRTTTASNPEDSIVGTYSGLVGLANRLHTCSTNLFTLSLIWFAISIGIIGGIVIGFVCIIPLLRKSQVICPSSCMYELKYWKRLLFNALMKWVFICFPVLIVLAVFQFTLSDAYGPIILAATLLALFAGLFAWCLFEVANAIHTNRFLTKGSKGTINDPHVFTWWGWMYLNLKDRHWYFFIVRLVLVAISGLLLAFLQNYGKVQSIILFAIEVVAISLLIGLRPYFGTCSMMCALLINGTRLISMVLLIPMAFDINIIRKVIIGILIIIIQGLVFSVLTIWGFLNFLSMIGTLWPAIKYQSKWLGQIIQQNEQDTQPAMGDHKVYEKEDPAFSSFMLENVSSERVKEDPELKNGNDLSKATEESSIRIPMPMHPSPTSSYCFSDFSEIQRTPIDFYKTP
ncbi:Trp-like ion channel [Schizosaccharomyces cryophilus OY26]|uniref:Trp-like ion channel n=1 Tax=Schizosaccharomyces cryophilus (strain OY26 / ATCC MYA-4695 / CBS 11777 / NBRC 106824 / NRRL Y48691) TaxID=653667 RepID=S9VWH5_SCHCR|nr:Trp-like ion channel [Schizosaccharomyces cryophilus OY26]EPY51998.1 Trp-like ion channel [Schizosaccharomyces cryophilus OY26]